ncbi:MAG: hypothetical protein ACRD26_14920 [Vicinamibacterales bacterium]
MSGIPAVAVVCDLLLCVDPMATSQQSCHDHGVPQSGARVGEGAAGCSHLAASVPYLASPSRLAEHEQAAVVDSVSFEGPVERPLRAGAWRGFSPPGARPSLGFLPLRI